MGTKTENNADGLSEGSCRFGAGIELLCAQLVDLLHG